MDKELIKKFEADPELGRKLEKVCLDYINAGEYILNYYSTSFNVAHDTFNCYRSLNKKDIELYDRGCPRFYVMPMTANHISTMTSFITGTLFGSTSPLSVHGRRPEDQQAADLVNQLLRWNNEQQKAGMYQLGYHWVEASLLYNRGVMYESWKEKHELTFEEVDTVVSPKKHTEEKELDANGEETGETYLLEHPEIRAKVMKKVKKKVGGYNHIEIISPYDFYCDPSLPLYRAQEGRFAGHRSNTSWSNLHIRATRDKESPEYVFPKAVKELRAQKDGSIKDSSIFSNNNNNANDKTQMASRTAYDRTGGGSTASPYMTTDKNDGGVVEIHELWIRLIPSEYDLGDSDEPELYRLLVGNRKVLLAIEASTYLHDEFPYAIGEPRPSAFYPYAPSWAIMLKPIQDMVDYLKDRHQDAIARTVGNIFIARSQFVDLEDFTNPEKDGMILPITDMAPPSMALDEIVKQVPLTDMTANFYQEMAQLMSFSEQITAASSAMQGDTGNDVSATATVAGMEMASGRLMTVSRLLAVQGILPQVRRFVKNFQQFLDDEIILKIRGNQIEVRPEFIANNPSGYVSISRDVIEGEFEFSADDITLPGTNTKQVAALSRALETAAQIPGIFDPADPGALNPKAIFLYLLKSADVPIENFINGQESAAKAAQKQASAKTIEAKDITALAALIKAIKPEEASAVQPIIAWILNQTGITPQQAQQMGLPPVDPNMANLPQNQSHQAGMGTQPHEATGMERDHSGDIAGLNSPGMPNMTLKPSGPKQIRPNQI